MNAIWSRHKHLRRLDNVWLDPAIYFITTCVSGRRRVLARDDVVAILRAEFEAAPRRHGWTIGSFVAMPDHLHFFCAVGGKDPAHSLSHFMREFKQWTSKKILRLTGSAPALWQREFFDTVMRSQASYDEKWRYVFENPVRAGLVDVAEAWPHRGELNALTPCRRDR